MSDFRAPQSAGDVGPKHRLSLQRAIFFFTLCCRSCTFTSISYVEEVRESDEWRVVLDGFFVVTKTLLDLSCQKCLYLKSAGNNEVVTQK